MTKGKFTLFDNRWGTKSVFVSLRSSHRREWLCRKPYKNSEDFAEIRLSSSGTIVVFVYSGFLENHPRTDCLSKTGRAIYIEDLYILAKRVEEMRKFWKLKEVRIT